MKNSNKLILGIVLIIVVLAAAGIGYKNLAKTATSETVPVADVTEAAGDAAGDDAAATGEAADAAEAAGDETAAAPELTPAPDFACLDESGSETHLSVFIGTPVVINFWATWCPPCRNELGSFNQMYEKYGEEVQFMMVDLTDGDRETIQGVKDFIVENAYSFPVFYDTKGSGMMAYGITAVPQTFFITADGKIYGQYFGSVTEEQIESALQELTGK